MGFSGNLGDPNASLVPNTGKDEPVEKHPGLVAAGFPCGQERMGEADQGIRRNVTNGVSGDARGSLSGFIVPMESRRTEPWEPGSREGNRLVEAASGKRGQDTEPVSFVDGTGAGGDGRLPSTGRTVCRKSARTGLWGSRWVTTGSTRKHRLKPGANGICYHLNQPVTR